MLCLTTFFIHNKVLSRRSFRFLHKEFAVKQNTKEQQVQSFLLTFSLLTVYVTALASASTWPPLESLMIVVFYPFALAWFYFQPSTITLYFSLGVTGTFWDQTYKWVISQFNIATDKIFARAIIGILLLFSLIRFHRMVENAGKQRRLSQQDEEETDATS